MTTDQGGFVAALLLSVGLHAGLFSLTAGGEVAMLEAGSEQATTVRLGNSFQDLSAGQAAVPVDPSRASQVPLEPEVVKPVPATVPLATSAPRPEPSVTPLVPAASEVQPPVAKPVSATQSVVGQEPEPQAKSDPKPKAQPKPEPPAPVGGSEESRAGQADGEAEGQAQTRATTEATGAAEGTAKASNYPGLVMKKLKKTRKDRVSGSGTALVGFTIASDGSLAGAKIVRSSGSDAVDKAALALVARAAPFPPPPKGAERSFSFEFSGG
jgi:periplasmic protein TonB